ncbi:MAG: gamma-glutamylcyclotransferase, partial [Kiritimatiellae bacterium]|nr:gamma-glutamylcyclotransferase [Kiritimatiellia bacterium]
DVEKARGGRVEGVLYLVTRTELHRLDLCEGYPNIYNCVRVIVHAELMGNPSVCYRVPAFTYAMTKETRRKRDGIPYPEDYRIVCATGARYWGIPNVFGALKPVEKRRWVGMK